MLATDYSSNNLIYKLYSKSLYSYFVLLSHFPIIIKKNLKYFRIG